MPETNVLDRLISFGIKQGFFEDKLLGELYKGCCPCSKVKVIDFDKAKEKILASTHCQQSKSADAIKILPDKNQIDFIELKGFEEFIFRNWNKENIDELINKQMEKFNLFSKISDSLFVMTVLSFDKNLCLSNQEKKQYQNTIKNYFIVVNISLDKEAIKDRAITLGFIIIKNKILQLLNQDIDNISESSLENLQKPRLFSCSEIDCHYNLTSQETI